MKWWVIMMPIIMYAQQNREQYNLRLNWSQATIAQIQQQQKEREYEKKLLSIARDPRQDIHQIKVQQSQPQ